MHTTVHNTPHPGGGNASQTLPLDGFTRWAELKRFVPFSHETIRRREGAGRFPKRVKLGSSRSVAWPNRELHRWMADPMGYRASDAAVTA
ncbi:helix-turn-helix transcriptional regulator [Burkholderia vietnamiensis]|uniref:helix-turn-helix transcriptional regulator n=1 Tax=Burkholderia vietnamiensis TaxID=60552 RepID=UPI0009C194B4|nr:AlpA family phage regulatory protein [Burkholderia vietnamiensis]MBR8159972.1 AlpA family phage regulatory protein [Burkholderia vietnamiensis]MBR8193128.1 AlpA family phage regulatory protein [Burkholderia vietnamiensis]MCA7984182.1 AlpA family phage regulatory protein [Burkholderia vietnamiensis]